MIIEIKNLPEGRRVKHINVDITFEEDKTVKTKVENFPVEFIPPTVYGTDAKKDSCDNTCTETDHTAMTSSSTPVIPEGPSERVPEREPKEIPPEMRDSTF